MRIQTLCEKNAAFQEVVDTMEKALADSIAFAEASLIKRGLTREEIDVCLSEARSMLMPDVKEYLDQVHALIFGRGGAQLH